MSTPTVPFFRSNILAFSSQGQFLVQTPQTAVGLKGAMKLNISVLRIFPYFTDFSYQLPLEKKVFSITFVQYLYTLEVFLLYNQALSNMSQTSSQYCKIKQNGYTYVITGHYFSFISSSQSACNDDDDDDDDHSDNNDDNVDDDDDDDNDDDYKHQLF